MFLLLALLLSSSSIITKNKVGGVCDAFFILSSSVSPRTARYHNTKTSIAYNNVNHEDDEESRTIHKVVIDLPLGIILEEETGHDGGGVVVVGINDNSNTAKYNSSIMSKVKQGRERIDCQHDFICIRDKIISVNDISCHNKGLDDVINIISNESKKKSSNVEIELSRIQETTVVNYYNGICISAKAGESYGFLADKCGITDVKYECRTGNCSTCMRQLQFPDKERDVLPNADKVNLYERTILHCVGKVPRNYQWLHVLEPRRNEEDA